MLREIAYASTVRNAKTDKLGTLTIIRNGGDRIISGNQYERARDMTRAQIAKEIRTDLKQHWETDFGDYDPAEVKVSVRTHNYAGGGSIRISIVGIKNFDKRYQYREDFQLPDVIKQIAQRYQRQTTNPLEDYCHNNFFLFVDLDPDEVMEQVWGLPARPPEPTPEDYRWAGAGKYMSVPGLVVSDIEPDDCKTGGQYIMAYVWVTDEEARAAEYSLEAPGIGETTWRVQNKIGNDIHECESEEEAHAWIAKA